MTMKPNLMLGSFVALVVSGSAVQFAMQGPSGATPKFNIDPAWPKIPNNWQFGQVASVSVDADDHVWILQRPSTLEPHEKGRAAPPVLEFDAAGTFLRGWGGPGTGFEWPSSEHGIYVDHRQFVWVGGNGPKDHQILKFTKDGKFVMQIGKAGQSKGNTDTHNLNQPADTFVHAKTNELLVADGYGNRRIIVFDADTGAFKRMWGAFGNPPQTILRILLPQMPTIVALRSSCSRSMRRVSPSTDWFTSQTEAASVFRYSPSMAST